MTHRPLTIIESPYAGNILQNTHYAIECVRDSIDRGELPFASHLLYTRVLDDYDPLDRKLGLSLNFEMIRFADRVAVYVDLGTSSGMQEALHVAMALGKPIHYRVIR